MMIHEMNLALCTLGSTLGSTGFPMTYLHMVVHSVDIRRVIGRHSFITGVVCTIHCLSATICVGGEASPTNNPMLDLADMKKDVDVTGSC